MRAIACWSIMEHSEFGAHRQAIDRSMSPQRVQLLLQLVADWFESITDGKQINTGKFEGLD